jgi:hypothetical protein
LWFFEPNGLVGFAIVHKLGGQHTASAQGFAIGFERFVDH